MRILVIEDNPRMASALARGLREIGYSVDVSLTGFDGEDKAASTPYDLIVLDLMLPDRDGTDVARNLRRLGVSTPILMLTALSSTEEKVSGLDAGADDYLTKPFEFEELAARVRALLRRGEPTTSVELRYADVEMNLLRRTVRRGGREVDLTPKEFALLEYMLRNPGKVLTRTLLGEKVWDLQFEPDSNVIDVFVSQLRRKLDPDRTSPLLHTVVGAGYRFETSP